MAQIIKMQCKDKNGNLLAYHQEIKSIEEAMQYKLKWQDMYGKNAYLISINFFQVGKL